MPWAGGPYSRGQAVFWNSGGLATRACGEELQPILVLSRNKDLLYYFNWVGPEAPRGCTGLKTESSRLATLGFSHMASAQLPSVLYGVLLALHERQHCGEIQIRTQHRKQQSEGKQAAGPEGHRTFWERSSEPTPNTIHSCVCSSGAGKPHQRCR